MLLFACAEGGEIGGGSASGGGSSDGGSSSQGAGPTTTDTTTTTTGTGAGPEGGMAPMGGGGAGVGGDPGTGGGGPVCNFSAPEMCAAAEPLPAISGDEGSDVVTRTGVGSKWFKVHVEETDSGIFGADLSYRVSLASPPGMNYDLKIHQGAQAAAAADCNGALKTGAGTPESVSDNWGDDQGFGGEDDSVWLVIEIVYVSGNDCSNGATWTLQVLGHV